MTPYFEAPGVTLWHGDALNVLRALPDQSVNCCVTSPPYYFQRNYNVAGQIGLEQTPQEYVARLVAVFEEVRRVLCDDGAAWVNLGDSYASSRSYQVESTKGGAKHSPAQGLLGASKVPEGLKPKDLLGIPWRVAFALQDAGWYLRSDIIWHKPNPMPESVTDRPTKAHEYLFLLAKSERYWYDAEAIKEAAMPDNSIRDRDNTRLNNTPGRTRMGGLVVNKYETRNRRTVWTIPTTPYKGAHFATMPPDLVRPCILAGCPVGGVVLDPFIGSGTVAAVAIHEGRQAVGIDLNAEYLDLSIERIKPELQQPRLFTQRSEEDDAPQQAALFEEMSK